MKKLHLGCGDRIIKGFINVDIRPETGCDIVDDISVMSSFLDNDVDLIYACHVLEHFGRDKYKEVLTRWYSVLKEGGILRLSVPDFSQVVNMYVANRYGLKKLKGFLYGGQDYDQNFHYNTFDFKSLKEDLEEIGFKNVERWNWREVEHGNVDDYSQAHLPHMDKEHGTLMSLNIQAKK